MFALFAVESSDLRSWYRIGRLRFKPDAANMAGTAPVMEVPSEAAPTTCWTQPVIRRDVLVPGESMPPVAARPLPAIAARAYARAARDLKG